MTKEKEFIFCNAAASVVFIDTWFSHFDTFKMVTSPVFLRLSRYRGVTGRSVLSNGMEYRVRRAMLRADKYCEGLESEKGEVALFLN